MSWALLWPIMLLMLFTALLVCMVHGIVLDARRQDAIKRRDAGL